MTGRMEGQVSLVNGGTIGAGAAMVRLFSAEGGSVAFTGRNVAEGTNLADELSAAGRKVRFIQVDARDLARVGAAVEETVETFGRLDSLVNVGAATGALRGMGGTTELNEEDWVEYFRLGLMGSVVEPIKRAIPHLIAAGGGSIVNVGSATAIRATRGPAPYVAVKGAQESLTRFWALELFEHKIRCNALILGYVNSGSETIETIKNTEVGRIYEQAHLLGMGQPDDIAYAAIWLASPESRWVTGQTIPIEGGSTIYMPTLGHFRPEVKELGI